MGRPKTRSDEDKQRYQREWYLANRERVIAMNVERKRRKSADRRAAKEAEAKRLSDAGIKVCACCHAKKLKVAFYRARNRPDGLYPYCKPCQDTAVQKHHERRGTSSFDRYRVRQEKARALVDEAKKEPCADCGLAWPPQVMHFHHLDPETKVDTVSRMVARATLAAIRAEMAKCLLLCANCHTMRHYESEEAA